MPENHSFREGGAEILCVVEERSHYEDAWKTNRFQSPWNLFEPNAGKEWCTGYHGLRAGVLSRDFHK